HIIIKHANGSGLGFDVDGKTKIEGHGVSSMKGLKKGQIVKVHHAGKHATRIAVDKQAPVTKPIVGKDRFSGTVTKLKTDEYGDTGHVWVKDSKGVTKEFHVSNATTIDYKRGGQVIVHTLQGIHAGHVVNVLSKGKEAAHIDAVMSETRGT